MKSLKIKIFTSLVLISFSGVILTSVISLYQIYGISVENMRSESVKLSADIKNDIDLTGMDDIDGLQNYAEGANQINKNVDFVKIYDQSGKAIVSNDKKDIGQITHSKNFKNCINKNKLTGSIIHTDTYKTVYQVFIPINSGDDKVSVISVGMSTKDMYKKMYQAFLIIFIVGMLITTVSIIVSSLLSGKIVKPLYKLISKFELLSQGDLTVEFKMNAADEFTKLSRAADTTVNNISRIIKEIKNDSLNMDTISREVLSSSNQYDTSSSLFYNDIERVSQDIDNQGQDIIHMENMLERFGNNLDLLYEKFETISQGSEEIEAAAELGTKNIRLQIEGFNEMKNSFYVVADKAKSLSDAVDSISQITNVINDVAGQTNLLALNAAIEAARVGQLGTGFAVVADEIRKLANEVLLSSKKIDNVIDKFKNETIDVSNKTTSVTKEMDHRMDEFKCAALSFEGILNQVSEIVPELKEVETTLEKSVIEKDNLKFKINKISDVAHKITDSTIQITGNINNQSKLATDLKDLSKDLNRMSKILNSNVEQFII